MKKFIISLALSLLIIPLTYAATMRSHYANILTQNMVTIVAPITILAESSGEITAEHGINIMLEPD